MARHSVRNYLLLVVKVGLACLVLWYLARQAQQSERFVELRDQPKHWGLLALATVCCLASVVITFLRWMLLVRALGIPFSVADAFRLGFQSYALNFVSLGSVGGDLFKAIFIAREQHGRRAEAVATVVLDRLVGLYALFIVSAAAVVFAWWQEAPWLAVPEVRNVARATIIATIIGAVLCLFLFLPGLTRGKVGLLVERLPGVGRTAHRLLESLHLYRTQRGVMAFSLFISLFVHLLMALSVWLVAQGLPGDSLTLGENILAVPLAALAGAIPLFPSGLGAFEGVLDFLYQKIGALEPGQGFIVALGFRVITMIVAVPGVYYLIRGRRKVAEVMHDVEAEEEAEEQAQPGKPAQDTTENAPLPT